MTSEHSIDCALARHAAQDALFGAKPARADILDLKLPAADARRIAINVWRNHNFETLSGLVEPYALFGRWLPDWRLGPYDDTLMFEGWQRAEAELVWLDGTRLGGEAALPWLEQRLQTLRAQSHAPILLVTWHEHPAPLRALCERLPEVYLVELQQLCRAHSVELLNDRTSGLTGTPIGKSAQLVIARELACHALPAILFPPIKAIALDLDETLHAGVLGEDGASRVQPHRALQEQLQELRERGVFLALVSRNEARDVEHLFAARADYPLRLQDFSATELSWGPKSAALSRIAQRLRIGLDAMLFVDDNVGELAEVAATLPALHTLHAAQHAELTQRALSFYPGLWRFRAGSADKLRVADLQANVARDALAARLSDPTEYFRSLQVKLSFRCNPLDQLERLAELSMKTNQFNLALRRWGVAKLREYLTQPGSHVVSVQLQDRLSDSGVIAIVCAQRQDTTLRVDELCISCRALGRRLEQSIVMLALRSLPSFRGCTRVVFEATVAARNQPALQWLATALGRSEPVMAGAHVMPAASVNDYEAPSGMLVAQA